MCTGIVRHDLWTMIFNLDLSWSKIVATLVLAALLHFFARARTAPITRVQIPKKKKKKKNKRHIGDGTMAASSNTNTLRQPIEDDRMNFPILQKVLADVDYVTRLQPSDMDALGNEVTMAYQRCALDERSVSPAEQQINSIMLGCIGTIDKRLEDHSARNPNVGAMLMLYRRSVLTSRNLSALNRMCDHTVRSGMVRCQAFWHLNNLTKIRSVWKVPLEDGTSFAMAIIKTMGQALNPSLQAVHASFPYCQCRNITWPCLCKALAACLDPPDEIVKVLLQYDWPSILQHDDVLVQSEGGVSTFYDIVIFIGLHQRCYQALGDNPENAEAKKLLRRLGTCWLLFRRCQRRVISGEAWTRPRPNFMEDSGPVVRFSLAMLHCLCPVPDDRDLDAQVQTSSKRISDLLCKFIEREAIMESNAMVAIKGTKYLLELMGEARWQELKLESDAERWERFRDYYLTGLSPAAERKRVAKDLKDTFSSSVKQVTDLSLGEMCANCFVLDSDHEKATGSKLSKCARCGQIKVRELAQMGSSHNSWLMKSSLFSTAAENVKWRTGRKSTGSIARRCRCVIVAFD